MEERERGGSLLCILAVVLATVMAVWLLWTTAADKKEEPDRQRAIFVLTEREEMLNG